MPSGLMIRPGRDGPVSSSVMISRDTPPPANVVRDDHRGSGFRDTEGGMSVLSATVKTPQGGRCLGLSDLLRMPRGGAAMAWLAGKPGESIGLDLLRSEAKRNRRSSSPISPGRTKAGVPREP